MSGEGSGIERASLEKKREREEGRKIIKKERRESKEEVGEYKERRKRKDEEMSSYG